MRGGRIRVGVVACGVSLLLAVSACGESPTEPRAEPSPKPSTSPTAGTSPTPTETPTQTRTQTPTRAPARRVRGIDVSHHQGPVDWARVRRAGMAFAYLKATEGTGFTDPRFASHAREARDTGLQVGGYHYFSMCSPGVEQADHFVDVLEAAELPDARSLPPAIDLELLGHSCALPDREAMLREVRAFLQRVEGRTSQEVVVYAYPEFEERFSVRQELARRLWVRRIGDRPPAGEWWMWQRSDTASVPGIAGGVDLNVLDR